MNTTIYLSFASCSRPVIFQKCCSFFGMRDLQQNKVTRWYEGIQHAWSNRYAFVVSLPRVGFYMLQTGVFPVQPVQPGATSAADNAATSTADNAARPSQAIKDLLSRKERMLGLPSKALLVGCNYCETDFALRGCIHDVDQIEQMLTDIYGMHPDSIITMTVRCTSPSADANTAAQSILKSVCARSAWQPFLPKALFHSRNALTPLLCQESCNAVQDEEGWWACDAPTGKNIKVSIS